MKKNISSLDRIIRLMLVAVMMVLYLTNVVTGTLGIVFIVLSGILFLTSLIGFCPLYRLLGLSTT